MKRALGMACILALLLCACTNEQVIRPPLAQEEIWRLRGEYKTHVLNSGGLLPSAPPVLDRLPACDCLAIVTVESHAQIENVPDAVAMPGQTQSYVIKVEEIIWVPVVERGTKRVLPKQGETYTFSYYGPINRYDMFLKEGNRLVLSLNMEHPGQNAILGKDILINPGASFYLTQDDYILSVYEAPEYDEIDFTGMSIEGFIAWLDDFNEGEWR